MRFAVAPGTCLNSASPWAHDTVHGTVLRVHDVTLAVRLLGEVETEVTDQAVHGSFRTAPGSRHLVGVTAAQSEPLHLSTPREVDARLDRTVAAWQQWSGQFRAPGPWADDVARSALLLKLLLHAPSGVDRRRGDDVTAGEPPDHGQSGGRNGDHRLAWIRDAASTLRALFRFGLREETQTTISWLLRTIHRHGPQMQAFYRLDGELPAPREFPDVPGWRGIAPVVVGNAAVDQLQLSVFGDVFDMVRLYVDHGHVLDAGTGRLLAAMADQACDAWRHRDAGRWELPRQEHYTSSKLSCWQALRCAHHLARTGQIPGDPARWAGEAERIARWVHEHCWSDEPRRVHLVPGHGRAGHLDPPARRQRLRRGPAHVVDDRRAARRARRRPAAVPLHGRGEGGGRVRRAVVLGGVGAARGGPHGRRPGR